MNSIKISSLASTIIHLPAQIKWSLGWKADKKKKKKHHRRTHEQADVFKKWLSFLILPFLSRAQIIVLRSTQNALGAHFTATFILKRDFRESPATQSVSSLASILNTLGVKQTVSRCHCLISRRSQDPLLISVLPIRPSPETHMLLAWKTARAPCHRGTSSPCCSVSFFVFIAYNEF